MRIGIIYPATNSVAPANWSGIPAGLADGLTARGADVVPIDSTVPVGRRAAVAVVSRGTGRRGEIAARMEISRWARTRALAAQLDRALPLAAVVAMGTEMYDLPADLAARVPIVTYDDATMAQQIREPDSDVSLAAIPDKLFARSAGCQQAASQAATVCCVSTRWAGRSFEADYAIAADRIAVVGMGHRLRRAPAAGQRDWSTPKFLFVGAEWHRKNGAAVLAAFEKLRTSVPTATLDLVGDHPRVARPGVTTHGFLAREDPAAQARLDRLYATSTCFVLPSRFDAAGIAYLEAGSSGLAVIATNRGGAPEMLDDGAVVVDPHDPEALYAAMVALCDPDTARELGAAAARNAAASSWSTVAGRLLDALNQAAGTDPRYRPAPHASPAPTGPPVGGSASALYGR